MSTERRSPTATLLWGQVRYENRLFWRTPVAAFFTIVLPLMILFLFALLFGDGQTIDLGERGSLTVTQFFAPALGVFAVASATYTNIGVKIAIARDDGVLKRFRGTPLPPSLFLAGKVGSAAWIAALAVILMMAVGHFAFDVPIQAARLPAAAVTFVVGAAAFSALGLAVGAVAPSGDSAPAITNATILPAAFVSEVFIVASDPPSWLALLGDVLPLKHFVRAFQASFSPTVTDLGFRWGHMAIMAAWGVVGAIVALRSFDWEARGRGGRHRSRRTASAQAGDDR